MLQFILGVIVGSLIGFLVCAVLSSNKIDDENSDPCQKEVGENDDPK